MCDMNIRDNGYNIYILYFEEQDLYKSTLKC